MTDNEQATAVAPEMEQAAPAETPQADNTQDMRDAMNHLLLVATRECAAMCFETGREAVAAAQHSFMPHTADGQPVEGVEPVQVFGLFVTGGNKELLDKIKAVLEASTGATLEPLPDDEPNDGSDGAQDT